MRSAKLIGTYLRKEGAIVKTAFSAEEALFSISAASPELVVLDLGLPGADGFDFLRVFRESSSAPVIIVSARESDEDKIEGLGLGADDFVSKPFSPRVLTARVKAQLRKIFRNSGPKRAFRIRSVRNRFYRKNCREKRNSRTSQSPRV